MARDRSSERHVRQVLAKAEERDRAPAYLFAAPGVTWWLSWLYLTLARSGAEEPARQLIGFLNTIPVMILSCVAVAFGLCALALLRVGVGRRLLLCAVNVSGPIWLLAR
ncbi:MAG TPA: hypothetical protein VFY93_08130 [Planctomycetota bacterium]|nr:hypothetical protein [Planctomycetota bacterium]